MPNIAVICNERGYTAPLFGASCVRVFRLSPAAQWRAERELPVALEPEKGLRQVRLAVQALIAELEGTRVIVGQNVSGVAYNLFNAAGFAIFEMVGRPERYLGFVEKQFRQEEAKRKEAAAFPTRPVPMGEAGVYRIDLIDLAAHQPAVSSKMALLPFFKETPFDELRVRCAHVPPWFSCDLPALNLRHVCSRGADGVWRVHIFHADCHEKEERPE